MSEHPNAWIATHAQPSAWCPICARAFDAVTSASVGGGPPEAPVVPALGDAVICVYCSAVLIKTEWGFRLATAAECEALPDVAKAVAGAVAGWTIGRRQ